MTDAAELRSKHLERAHNNLDKIERNAGEGSLYAAALAAAADAYMAGYYATAREFNNPFLHLDAP